MTDRPMHAVPGAFQKLQQLYAEGEAAFAEQDYETAIDKFTEGLGIDDHFRQRYITMYAQRAFAYLRVQDYENAIPDFDKAIEMEPEPHRANYHFQRALCFWQGAQNEAAALADLDKANGYAAEFWMPYDLRGRIHLAAGRYADAMLQFQLVLDRNPNEQTKARLEEARAGAMKAAQSAQATVASGGGGDADPVVFPGQPGAKLSDYVKLMKKMQTGDMQGALSMFGLDMMAYGGVAAQWAGKLGADPTLNAKFMKLLTGG